jgi:hypothetical protein
MQENVNPKKKTIPVRLDLQFKITSERTMSTMIGKYFISAMIAEGRERELTKV